MDRQRENRSFYIVSHANLLVAISQLKISQLNLTTSQEPYENRAISACE
jgi:hypothetical protein